MGTKLLLKGGMSTFLILFIILATITLETKYLGSTDIGDYLDTAKFFAGHYRADIRASNSYMYGYIFSFFYRILDSPLFFKIASLLLLALIIYSVYFISGKDKKALVLIAFSPVIWYMGPWISPIQFASLTLLWAYFFILKFDRENKTRYLLYSGLFIGLGWMVWNTMLHLGFLLLISFLYNKRMYYFILAAIAVAVGLIPRLLFDQHFYGFLLYGIMRGFFSTAIGVLSGGIYNAAAVSGGNSPGYMQVRIVHLTLIFISIPYFFWISYKLEQFKKQKKAMIFLTLALLLIFINPQMRYLLAIIPIITLTSLGSMSNKPLGKQIIIFIIAIVFIITPYAIQSHYQIGYDPEGVEIASLIVSRSDLKISHTLISEQIAKDLILIDKSFPNQTFVVGNKPDDYAILSRYYLGEGIIEFVSLEDYNLYLMNKTEIFSRELESHPTINDRRQIWIKGGIKHNEYDPTNFNSIKYAISTEKEFNHKSFKLIKEYGKLNVFEKS